MKIFGYELTKNTRAGVNMPSDLVSYYFPESDAGVVVSPATAKKLTAVGACIKVISETLGQISVDVYKKVEDGKVVYTEHPAQTLIKVDPNSYSTSSDFHEAMMRNVLIYGNSYALIHRKGMTPTELEVIHPEVVNVKYNDKARKVYYEISGNTYQSYEVIHIKGATVDGLIGVSPLREYADAIGLGIAEQTYASKHFANGATPQAVMTFPGKLTQEMVSRANKMWNSRFKGVGNSGKLAMLEQGQDIKTIANKPSESQLIESRRLTIEEIARIFRVPPHMIGDLMRSTNNNIEHQSLEFVKFTMIPWIKKFEQEYRKKLLKEAEKSTVFFRFNVESLMRGDTETRTNMYVHAIQNGWLNRNEVRQLEGWNKADGLDDFLIPLNMTEIGKEKENEDTGANDQE
jgi:HK97 family phage portal protein